MNELAIFKQQLNLIELENKLSELEQVEIPIIHDFMGGVYVRQMLAPKDTLIIGKRHRHETCNILLSGKLSVYVGANEPVKHIEGPCIFKSESGAKKMGYTHTDVIFLNIHPTIETDLDKIEAEFIISEEEYMEQIIDIKKVGEGEKCHG